MSELPSWAIGRGLETDMTGDRTISPNIRFWLKKGEERQIIFLTEGNYSFGIWEHQVNINGSWKNWFTCIGDSDEECPICQYSAENNKQFRRYKAMFFTIIDTTEFTDKSGEKRKNLKKLMCCKKDTAETITRQYTKRIDAGEGLKGALYEVFRPNSDKSANVGENFDFVKMIDLDSLPDAEEFDYMSMLAPDIKGMQRAYRALTGQKEALKEEGTDDKVAF